MDWNTRFCLEGLMDNMDKGATPFLATQLDRTQAHDVKTFKEEMGEQLRKTMI